MSFILSSLSKIHTPSPLNIFAEREGKLRLGGGGCPSAEGKAQGSVPREEQRRGHS